MPNYSQPEPPEDQSPAMHSSHTDPRDAIFTSIMWIMIANVLAGAVMVIAGETMNLSPAVGQVGLGLVVICGGLYFFFRWFQRKEARRRQDQSDGGHGD